MSLVPLSAIHSEPTAHRIQARYDALIPGLDVYGPYGRVYPIDRSKQPLIQNFKRNSARPDDRETILHWLSMVTCSGLGLHIESCQLLIFDCEHFLKKGPQTPKHDGMNEFKRFWQRIVLQLPDHLTVRSGSDGLHHAFLLPIDLVPEGKYFKDVATLPGIDLLSFGKNVIVPGSCVDVQHGTGEYAIVSGLEAGIGEMPRSLALALIEKMELKDIETLERKTKQRSRKRKSADSVTSPSSLHREPSGELIEPEVGAAIEKMYKGNRYFARLWDNQPAEPGHDSSASGQLFNIAKVTIGFHYDKPMARAIAQGWCKRYARPFNSKQWEAIYYQGAVAAYQKDQAKRRLAGTDRKGRGEGSNSKVHNHPPIFSVQSSLKEQHIAGTWLPLPERPDESKQFAFQENKQACASLARNRPDLEKRHSDNRELRDWKLTRSYLLSVAYYAFFVGCNEEEAIWYVAQFVRKSAPPEFELTPRALRTILDCGLRRVRGTKSRTRQGLLNSLAGQAQKITPSNKPRKQRCDKGTSKRLRQVARLREQGLGYRKIAQKLKLSPNTARDYCREVEKRGGTDRVLRPKKRKAVIASFDDPIAKVLFDARREFGHKISGKTANLAFQETMTYAKRVGWEGTLAKNTVRRIAFCLKDRNKNKLIRSLQTPIANSVCESNPTLKFLARRIQLCGLPSKREPKGIRYRYGFPKAVLRARQAVMELGSWLNPQTIEEFWKLAENMGNFDEAVKVTRREQLEREYEIAPRDAITSAPDLKDLEVTLGSQTAATAVSSSAMRRAA